MSWRVHRNARLVQGESCYQFRAISTVIKGNKALIVGQRQPRVECSAFLAFVRRRQCCACGTPAPSQAAHVRYSDAAHGAINPGVGAKPHDRRAVPLCPACHLDGPGAQHRGSERKFWERVNIDPYKLASDLYAQFERRRARTPAQREKVTKRAKRLKKKRTPPPNASFAPTWNLHPCPACGRIHARGKCRLKSTSPKRKWPSRPFPAGRKLRSR